MHLFYGTDKKLLIFIRNLGYPPANPLKKIQVRQILQFEMRWWCLAHDIFKFILDGHFIHTAEYKYSQNMATNDSFFCGGDRGGMVFE